MGRRSVLVSIGVLAATAGALTGVTSGVAATLPAAQPGQQLHRSILLLSPGAGSVTNVTTVTNAVRACGGLVVASYPVAHSLLVDLPAGCTPIAGAYEVPDRDVQVSGAASDTSTSTLRATVGGAGDRGASAGAGITVAVVDTGVATVPDLEGRVRHASVLRANGDDFGHGTFMAGLIAGSGASSNGRYAGIAPAAKIFDVRVASASGETSLSTVLAGLQAVSDRRAVDPSLRVLNLSLSEDSPVPPALDPLSQALETLWGNGITVVVAAGNTGPSNGTVTAPGNDPVVLTVGALDESNTANRTDDGVAAFSSRGVPFGGSAKPDLVAPGVSLVSLRAPGSEVDDDYPAARVGNAYFKGTGTSMSAAVTSGAVAVLLARRPSLTPDEVKAILTSSAYDVRARGQAEGAGGLDLATALVTAAPAGGSPGGRDFGPMAASGDAWAAFADAWAAGDLRRARSAFAALPDDVQKWATKAWALSVTLHGENQDATTQARAWSARAWSARAWSSSDWLARAWSARAWSDDDWAARAWSARAWSARAWSDDDWSAFTWTARAWSARAWSARSWSVVGWGS